MINYVIGNYRWILYSKFGGIFNHFISPHIVEQFEYRKQACPSCSSSYEAACCGCDIPQVFFAPKGCSNKKYPEMLSKKNWKAFKTRKRQWEVFITRYPGGEEALLEIGIRRNEYYKVVIDILDGGIFMSLNQVKALDIYRDSQFLKIEDTDPNITLDLYE